MKLKRLRLMVRITTAVLTIASIATIAILIINQRLNALDTIYEIVAFSSGAVGLILAVTSQIDTYVTERGLRRALDRINELESAAIAERKAEKRQMAAIDDVLTLEHKIYRKLPPKPTAQK
jgi:hypothetical protein